MSDPYEGLSEVELGLIDNWTTSHGALMALAWVILLPLGSIFARHRETLFHGREVKWFGQTKALWFYLHVTLQLSGAALFFVGWIIAFSTLPWGWDNGSVSIPSAGMAGQAHKGLGITTFALSVLQILVAVLLRPHPESPRRKYWNMFHWNIGRITILVAWGALFTGIYTSNGPKGTYSVIGAHAGALAGVIACLFIWDIVLEFKTAKLKAKGGNMPPPPAEGKQHTVLTMAG